MRSTVTDEEYCDSKCITRTQPPQATRVEPILEACVDLAAADLDSMSAFPKNIPGHICGTEGQRAALEEPRPSAGGLLSDQTWVGIGRKS